VTEVTTMLLTLHPELHDTFHGIWVFADEGSAPLFSLELPMDQIIPATGPTAATLSSANR
jgi:hypothetical protein